MKYIKNYNVKAVIKSVERDNQVKDKLVNKVSEPLVCKQLKCQHNTSKDIWKAVRTIKVKRNGNGGAIKTIEEQCAICKTTRVRNMPYTDTRIIRSL